MADAATRITIADRGGAGLGREWRVYKVFDAEPVNGAAAIVDSLAPLALPGETPNGLRLGGGGFFGLWVQAAGSSPRFDVQILEAWDDTAANYVVPETGGTPLSAIADTTARVAKVEPIAMTRLRVRLKANASNGADTTVTAYLFVHP